MFRVGKSRIDASGHVDLVTALKRFWETGYMMLHESNRDPNSYDSSDVCDNFRIDKLGGGIPRFDAALHAKDISEHANKAPDTSSAGDSSSDVGAGSDAA